MIVRLVPFCSKATFVMMCNKLGFKVGWVLKVAFSTWSKNNIPDGSDNQNDLFSEEKKDNVNR